MASAPLRTALPEARRFCSLQASGHRRLACRIRRRPAADRRRPPMLILDQKAGRVVKRALRGSTFRLTRRYSSSIAEFAATTRISRAVVGGRREASPNTGANRVASSTSTDREASSCFTPQPWYALYPRGNRESVVRDQIASYGLDSLVSSCLRLPHWRDSRLFLGVCFVLRTRARARRVVRRQTAERFQVPCQ